MNTRIYLLLTVLLSLLVYSQESKSLEVKYTIDMIGSPQTIVLSKNTDGRFKGYIETNFYKHDENSEKLYNVSIKSDIEPDLVESIMHNLKILGIESLTPCSEDPKCKSLMFLDGDGIAFTIEKDGKVGYYSFQEVYPENQYQKNLETIPLRRKAQQLITVVNNRLKLKKEFRGASRILKVPYSYSCGGFSICTVGKRK